MIAAGRLSSLESMLAGDHDRLDRAFQAIVTRAYGGDFQQLEAEWLTFQNALLRASGRGGETSHPRSRRRIGRRRRRRCSTITRRSGLQLLQLGVDLDLHCLRAERVEAFVDALRAHAHREEHIFYPWVDKQLGG